MHSTSGACAPPPAGAPREGRADRLARRLGLSRASLALLRLEVDARLARWRAGAWPPDRRRLARIRAARGLLVNVGCGPFPLDGFVNLDIRAFTPGVVVWDCRRTLPVADGACAGIRIEHFAEHTDPRDELPRLLEDCHRALAPGGVLRIVVPDTERYLLAYAAGGRAAFHAIGVPDPFPADLPTRMDVVNHAFHQWHEHRWGYDEETLRHRLGLAGFDDVVRMGFGRSHLPALAADRDEHRPYSLYVDAVKRGEARPA